jgi:hypothetical protein
MFRTKIITLLSVISLVITVSVVSVSSTIQSAKPFSNTGAIKDNILVGVSVHPWDAITPYFNIDEYFNLLNEIGVQWIRIDIGNPNNQWDINQTQLFLKQANTRGIHVLGILDGVTFDDNPNFSLDNWNNSVRIVLQLFGNTVDAWEVWNEPNSPSTALGYMDGTPQHYVDMLQSAYVTIKSMFPEVPVIFGGIAPTENGYDFVNRSWSLGAGAYCDAVAYHFFSQYLSTSTIQLPEIASLVNPKPIWITEVGADSLQFNLTGQAQQLIALRDYIYSMAVTCRIQRSFWYCWMDYAVPGNATNVLGNPSSSEDFFGLITVDLERKPAYSMYYYG